LLNLDDLDSASLSGALRSPPLHAPNIGVVVVTDASDHREAIP
jgi:hypothetical protein